MNNKEKHTERVRAYYSRLEKDGGARVTVILDPDAVALLDSARLPDEGRSPALRRLALRGLQHGQDEN